MKFRNIAYAAALLMLAGCATRKEQIYYNEDSEAVKLSAVIGCEHSTKSSPLATGEELRQFSFNDKVCIFTPDLVAEYYKSSTGWNPTDRYYFRWNTDPVTFRAYYPVNKSSGYDKFAVRPNQYSLDNLVASDYMTGEAVDKYREDVEIVLHRRMAKVTVKLAGLSTGQKVQSFKIGSYSVIEDGAPSGSTSISPYVETADIPAGEKGSVYTALVIPGPASSKIPFVTLTYNGKSLKTGGIPKFEAGNAYSYTVTVSSSSLTLSQPEVTCWNEALPSDDVPENPEVDPDQPGQPDEPENPENPENPDTPEQPEEPEQPSVPFVGYFVSVEGAGDKSGLSWDNAMGIAEFRAMISSDYSAKTAEQCEAIDGKTFYFKQGSYCTTTSEKNRLKIQFPNYGKACNFTILGGYAASSSGQDLTNRNPKTYETKFTGDLNGNGKADSGDTGIFCLDAYCFVTFDGCSFAHAVGIDRWKQKAFMLNTDTSGASVLLNLVNCKFYDLDAYKDNDGKYQGGTAIWVCKASTVTIHNCDFTGCISTSRGGAIRTVDASSVLYMNNCAVYGNKVNDVWGNGIQISNGNLAMNNCTVAKNTGAGGALNGGGNWMIVNSTIINSHLSSDDSRNMTVRNESTAGTNDAIMVNSIALFEGDKPSIVVASGENRILTSKGYNLYGTVCTDTSISPGTFVAHDSDKSSMTVSGLGLTWNNGYYTWSGAVPEFTAAKLSDVEAVVKSTSLGANFYNWLQGLESGKNPLALDQAGNARNTAAMWPGAYEKN
ncbi:MAG: fimbrillin family protein [Bacteroidales bacterium]|nr:fimbrillin family protein [Bacteroidales bacterium]